MDRLKPKKCLRSNLTEASDIGYLCEVVTSDEEFSGKNCVRHAEIDFAETSRISTISSDREMRVESKKKSRVLKRSGNALDSSDSVDYCARDEKMKKSIDVVVDVHEENKLDRENLLEDCENEISIEMPKIVGGKKKLLRSNNIGEKMDFGENPIIGGGKKKLLRSENIGENVVFGSLDERINKLEWNEVRVISAKSSPGFSEARSEVKFGEDFLGNENVENSTSAQEPKRRRRRRWSKNGKMMEVAREFDKNSNNNVVEGFFSGEEEKLLPKVDTRIKYPSDSSSVFDNAAFQSDHDEVLRIVTEVSDPKKSPARSIDNEPGARIKLVSLSTYSEKSTTSGRFSTKESKRIGETGNFTSSTDDHSSNRSDVRRVDISEEEENSRFSKKPDIRNLSKRKRKKSKASRTEDDRRESESSDRDDEIADSRSLKSSKSKSTSNDRVDESIEFEAKKFIAVGIHRADMLEPDLATRQPMLKVHVVGIDTGNYLAIHENNDARCKYLQPMITKPFVFRQHKSVIPKWEEDLIFDYDYDRILETAEEPVIFFFEILDLWNFNEASRNYETVGKEACWRKIAWAFLRPIGAKGVLHVNKKIRLQLYRPGKISNRPGRSKCEVFDWWKLKKLEKYPSSLYVSIRGVDPPMQEPIVYEELILTEATRKQSESLEIGNDKRSDFSELPKRIRLDAQSCKIPNDYLFRTDLFENGCFCVTFSNNGKYLACVVSGESEYPINVHTVPDGTAIRKLSGHKNFIYALNWSHDDKFLLSASSDQTACIWDVREEEVVVVYFQMLPHPSYVYCGKFDPGNKRVVATGCYDRRTRIWARSRNSKNYELIQELEKHKGYVNSLCFQRDGGLITADSVGVVILWSMRRKRSGRFSKEWHFSKKIAINEIESTVINTIILHPLGSRLLVHSRDNGLRMLDLADGVVLQQYHGLKNQRLQTTACISPCGGLIFCGGEDSSVNVWDLENGKHLAKYSIADAKIVASTDYHPFDNILAFSTFGNPGSVRVLSYRKESTGETVGLKLNGESKANGENLLPKYRGNYSEDIRLYVDNNREDRNPSNKSPRVRNSGGNYDENRVSLRSKMRKIRDTEKNVKSKSVRKLNNIIEKIDKILLNATSRYDDLTQSSASFGPRRDAVWTDSEKGCDEEDSEFPPKVHQKSSDCVVEICNETDNRTFLDVDETSFIRDSDKIREAGGSTKNGGSSGSWSVDAVEFVKKGHVDDEEDRGTRFRSKNGSPHTDDSTGTYIIEKREDPKSPNSEAFELADSSSPSCTISTVRSEVPVPKPRKKPASK